MGVGKLMTYVSITEEKILGQTPTNMKRHC